MQMNLEPCYEPSKPIWSPVAELRPSAFQPPQVPPFQGNSSREQFTPKRPDFILIKSTNLTQIIWIRSNLIFEFRAALWTFKAGVSASSGTPLSRHFSREQFTPKRPDWILIKSTDLIPKVLFHLIILSSNLNWIGRRFDNIIQVFVVLSLLSFLFKWTVSSRNANAAKRSFCVTCQLTRRNHEWIQTTCIGQR